MRSAKTLARAAAALVASGLLVVSAGCSTTAPDSIVEPSADSSSTTGSRSAPDPRVGGSVPATITLAAAQPAVPKGGSFTLTATLPADAVGQVGFYDRNIVRADKGIGVATVVDGTATLTQSTSALGPGVDHTITASWGGDTRYAAGDSRPITLTLTPKAISLTIPDRTFSAGSWGSGIIYEAGGLEPSAPVTLVLVKSAGPGAGTQATKQVNTDAGGNLSSVWTPPDPPEAAGPSGYPLYQVYAFQDIGGSTSDITSLVMLTVQ